MRVADSRQSNNQARPSSASLNLYCLNSFSRPLLRLDHVESCLLAFPLSGDPQQDANRVGDFSALADHAAHIITGHAQLKTDMVAISIFADFNLIRMFHQRFGNEFDEVFHKLYGVIASLRRLAEFDELITDSRSEIGARDLRSRETGIVAGKNDSTVRLTTMKEDADLGKGDVIETSGLGGTCPPGIPIGKITKLTNRSSGQTRYVEVQPYVDFSKLDNVLVVITPEPESIILRESQ